MVLSRRSTLVIGSLLACLLVGFIVLQSGTFRGPHVLAENESSENLDEVCYDWQVRLPNCDHAIPSRHDSIQLAANTLKNKISLLEDQIVMHQEQLAAYQKYSCPLIELNLATHMPCAGSKRTGNISCSSRMMVLITNYGGLR